MLQQFRTFFGLTVMFNNKKKLMEKKTSAKKKLADVGTDRRHSSRKSNVSPTETAHFTYLTFLRFTPPRQNVDSAVMLNIQRLRRVSAGSRLSQERLEQLMHVRMSGVSRSNITEKQLLL